MALSASSKSVGRSSAATVVIAAFYRRAPVTGSGNSWWLAAEKLLPCGTILLGHKLTKVARIAEAYGRTYDKVEEHDAYYLASATLLPKRAVADAVAQNQSSVEIGQLFGTSSELVDYRIKRLGLWREHVGKRVALNSEG